MFLPYVGSRIETLLSVKDEMNFELYWDGACGADKIKKFAPLGIKGFVLVDYFAVWTNSALWGDTEGYKGT